MSITIVRNMNILIAYSSEDISILSDVTARLGVLYPEYHITNDSNHILIDGVEPAQEIRVKQAALDQLIRSRFDARSVSLRETLYTKLLG